MCQTCTMGRKKLPKHRARTARVPFNCTSSQKLAYQKAAESCDKDLSEWIRDTLDAELKRMGKQAKGE